MKYLLPISITSLLLLSAFWMLEFRTDTSPKAYFESNEESKAKAKWIKAMLQDPATGEIPKGIRWQEMAFLKQYQKDYPAHQKLTRGSEWKSRGPWNVGGRTRAFAVDVTNDKHLIASSVSSGIWQSMDAGKSWTRATDINSYAGVVSISQDKRVGKTNIWYAITGELSGNSASGNGAYYYGDGSMYSIDNGNTWKPILASANQLPNGFAVNYQMGWRIASSPVDSVAACVYTATYGSIYRSADTGLTWKVVLGNTNDSYYTDVAVSTSGIVYASLSSDGQDVKGFYRSADGVNFTNITPPFLKNHNRTVFEINPNNENEVYFLSHLESDSSGGVVTANYEGTKEYVSLLKYEYLSGDGSGSDGKWTNLSQNLPVNSPNQFDKFNCQGGYDLCIRCQPGSNTIVVGGTNLYRSTDGFTTPYNTTQIGGYGIATVLANFTTYPNHHPDQHDLWFSKSNPKTLYSVSDGGVKVTHDANASEVVWDDISLGYITSQLYSVTIDESKPFDQWILGGFQDNGNFISKSKNQTSTWLQTVNGDGAYNYIAPNRDFCVISTQLGNVRKVKLDENGNVMLRKRIDPVGYDKSLYNFINYLAVNPITGNTLLMPIGKKIARLNNLKSIPLVNDDNKLSSGWDISKDTITTAKVSNTSANAEISVLAIAPSNPEIVYFGTSNREVYRMDHAMTGDVTFKKLPINRLPSGGYVSGIAVDPDSAKNVLLSYSNYNINSLFYSNDSGNNWYYIGGNLETNSTLTGTNPSVRCVNILVDDLGKRHYFAGTSIGLFSTDSLVLATNASSTTNKTVWQQESPEVIGASIVTDIKVRRSDGYVVIGTHGNGIFESYFTGKNSTPDVKEVVSANVYPNPANSELFYTFSNPTQTDIAIDIFDLSGRRVKRVLNDSYKVGTFTVKINVSDMASGHYFVAQSNSKSSVQHFVINR